MSTDRPSTDRPNASELATAVREFLEAEILPVMQAIARSTSACTVRCSAWRCHPL